METGLFDAAPRSAGGFVDWAPSHLDAAQRKPGAILALDLGSSTGWALKSPDMPICFGHQRFVPGRFEGGGMRFLKFKNWLTEMKGPGLGAIYFEEVRRHLGVDAAHCYGGFLAVLTSWCEHHQIPYMGVPVGTIKRHATGKGNADKHAMLLAARAKHSRVETDDEADAIALLDYVIKHL